MEVVIECLHQHRLPTIPDIKTLCKEAIRVLCEEPNVIRVDSPVVVVGDLHGQFYDLLEILHRHGDD
jgi:hypothetical protein